MGERVFCFSFLPNAQSVFFLLSVWLLPWCLSMLNYAIAYFLCIYPDRCKLVFLLKNIIFLS
jgi:hypothetical protein